MNISKKTIKYFAIGLALFIITTMALSLHYFTRALLYIMPTNNDTTKELIELKGIKNIYPEYLDLELPQGEIIIKKGDSLSIKTNSKKVKIENTDKKVKVTAKNNFNKNNKIIISTPQTLKELKLSTGAGVINISDILLEKLEYEAGVGKTTIANFLVKNEAKIEGGAGKIEITNSKFNNLKADLGVGLFIFKGEIKGKSQIEAGVGEAKINLTNPIDDYKMTLTKGIGKIYVNGISQKNNLTIGDGINNLKIEGGVGNIKITTK
jgi:hypothetical protein